MQRLRSLHPCRFFDTLSHSQESHILRPCFRHKAFLDLRIRLACWWGTRCRRSICRLDLSAQYAHDQEQLPWLLHQMGTQTILNFEEDASLAEIATNARRHCIRRFCLVYDSHQSSTLSGKGIESLESIGAIGSRHSLVGDETCNQTSTLGPTGVKGSLRLTWYYFPHSRCCLYHFHHLP